MADFEVKGFSAGITDDDKSQNTKEYVEADNLDIDFPSEDLITRGGSVINNETTPRPTTSRIGGLINMGQDSKLMIASHARLFSDEGDDGVVELRGMGANLAFPGVSDNMIPSHCEHLGHLYIVTDDGDSDGIRPVKIYRDEGDTLRLVTAGLPKFETVDPFENTTVAPASIVTPANALRTAFLAHYADTTRHPVGADVASAAIITASALAVGDSLATSIALTVQLMAAYKSHYYDAAQETGSRSYHSNSLGEFPGQPNVPLKYSTDPETWLQVAQRLNDMVTRHNWHMRSYRGHPSIGPDTVGSGVANVEEGPVFGNLWVAEAGAFAEQLRTNYNNHVADTAHPHSAGHAFGGAADLAIDSSVPDATGTEDAFFEVVSQLHAAMRFHDFDAKKLMFSFNGTTNHVNTDRINSLSGVVGTITQDNIRKGVFGNLEEGMFVQTDDAGAPPINLFASGTYIASLSSPNVTMSANHNSKGAASETLVQYFSGMKYHNWIGAEATDTDPSSSVVSLDIAYSEAANDLGLVVTMLNDVVAKFLAHDNKGLYHEDTGLNQFSYTDLVVNRYAYAFVFRRNYRISTGELISDISTPYFKSFVSTKKIEDFPNGISRLDSISNGPSDNYDLINSIVEIYRTEESGISYFLSGHVANGTTVYTDSVGDVEISSKEELYTDGGVLGNDPPPIAKVIHEHLGYAYYGNLKIGDDYLPNDIAQSVGEDLDSVPESNRVSLPAPVVGISSTLRDVVGFTKTGHYRLEGTIDERGQGAITPIMISEQIGLFGGLSPVQIDFGIVFAGPDGFYLTDAFTCRPISPKFSKRYADIVKSTESARRIQGTYDKLNQRVIWAVARDGDECDSMFVAHLKFGIGENGAAFTTRSGGSSFAPSAICHFAGALIRGDSRGYVFKHNDDYSDPVVDPDIDPSDWETQKIAFKYLSPAWSFGTSRYRKMVTKIVTVLENVGKTTVQLFRINDLGRVRRELAKITFSGRAEGDIEEQRYMPPRTLRCRSMQLELSNADQGQNDEKTRISGYSLNYSILGDLAKDVANDATEVANSQ